MKVEGPIRIVLLLSAFVGLALVLFLFQPDWLFHWQDFRVGNGIISRVDAFKKDHGRLPETLKEVGMNDPDLNVYYCKAVDDEYYVWFGTTLGESETFSSLARKWDIAQGACIVP